MYWGAEPLLFLLPLFQAETTSSGKGETKVQLEWLIASLAEAAVGMADSDSDNGGRCTRGVRSGTLL